MNASFQISVSFAELSIKERLSSGLFIIQFCAEFPVRKTQSGEMSFQTGRSATVAHKSNSKIARTFITSEFLSSLPPSDRTHAKIRTLLFERLFRVDVALLLILVPLLFGVSLVVLGSLHCWVDMPMRLKFFRCMHYYDVVSYAQQEEIEKRKEVSNNAFFRCVLNVFYRLFKTVCFKHDNPRCQLFSNCSIVFQHKSTVINTCTSARHPLST